MPAMRHLIRPLFLAGACLIALAPITAAASQTYHERVAGVETGFVSGGCGAAGDASAFAGIASGTLNGSFNAVICHTSLTTSATITGGTFTLSGSPTTVNGHFTGGTVVLIGAGNSGTFCYQNFSVTGGLASTTSSTPGSFNALLTHYGTWDGSTCNVRFATVVGRATITA